MARAEDKLGAALSPRQQQALASYARTGSMKETATEMGIAVETIKHHLEGAYARLGVSGLGAFAAFRQLGWLWTPDEAAVNATGSRSGQHWTRWRRPQ